MSLAQALPRAHPRPDASLGTRLPSVDPRAVLALWQREMTRYARDRGQILGGISRPALWLVVMGIGMGPSFEHVGGFSYAQFVLPGVIALNILFAGIQSAISIIWDREFGFMQALLVAPVGRSSIALGKIAGGSTLAFAQGALALAFAPAAGVKLQPHTVMLAVPAMLLVAITTTSLGVAVAVQLRSFEGFGVISNAIVMPLYFLSGALFPLSGTVGVEEVYLIQLPAWLLVLVRLNPLTYGVDAIRFSLMRYNQFPLELDIVALLALTTVAVLLAVRQFGRMEPG